MKFKIGITFIGVMMLGIAQAFAQTPPPSQPLIGAPLDALSMVLMVGGVAYGAVRLNRNKK
ncbi:MAG: hypothetical protein K9G46_01920 [Flavobacteriales bacterium]|nr:hypothetical protein [Flavobacteriales bacterium]